MLPWFVCSNPGCSPDTAAQRDMKSHWVITVKDSGDRGAGAFGYERRFEFGDTEEAFLCARGAQEAGFDVSAIKGFASRARLSSTMPTRETTWASRERAADV